MERSDVWNSQKMKRLREVEGSLWHRVELTVLKDKLEMIMKSIDEGSGFLMGLKTSDKNKESRFLVVS